MNCDREKNLERWADAELKRLPNWSAPATLIPRVQAALAAVEARSGLSAAWSSWPAAGRMAFVTVLAVVSSALLWGSNWMIDWLRGSLGQTTWSVPWLERAVDVGGALFHASTVLVQSIGPVWCWTAVGLSLGLYLFSLAVGTACFRLATLQR